MAERNGHHIPSLGSAQIAVRRLQKAAIRLGRRSDSWRRTIPGLLIIGAQRAGTTALAQDLGEHPQMARPQRKEVHFFDRHHDRGLGWYRSHFPTLRRMDQIRGAYGNATTGEATPNYLLHPHAAKWAKDELPGVRVVAMLRDPVDRAHSHWQLMTRQGKEDRDFAAALALEPQRIGPDLERLCEDPSHSATNLWTYSYRTRGCYAAQLARWIDEIGRERVFVIRSEDYRHNPAVTYQRLLDFLGLRPFSPRQFATAHTAVRSSIDPAVERELRSFYEPHNEALRQLLGSDIGWSRVPATTAA